MSKLNITISILFLTALALYWYTLRTQDQAAGDSTGDEIERPAYIAEGLRSIMYNDEGLLEHEIQAEQMKHFSDSGYTEFEHPVYFFSQKDQVLPWRLSADKASLFGSDRIVLQNNVIVETQDETNYITRIQTASLDVQLTDRQLSTADPVFITGTTFDMQGVGLEANLDTREVELTSQVQTIYKKAESSN